MKKLLIFSVVAIMAAGAYLTVNSSSNKEGDLVSKNIEALSQSEGGYMTCTGPKSRITAVCRCVTNAPCMDDKGCRR